jgi:ParB family chromosome partitioning protein
MRVLDEVSDMTQEHVEILKTYVRRNTMIVTVDINKLVLSDDRSSDPKRIQDLVDSIAKRGMVLSIVVRPYGSDKYQIIDGHDRVAVAKILDWTTIQVRVMHLSDEELKQILAIKSHETVEFRPDEYKEALLRIMATNPGMTKEQLAAKLEMSIEKLNNFLGETS